MKLKTYRTVNKLLIVCLLVGLIFSFRLGSSLLTFLVVGTYMALVTLIKTSVKGVLADERQIKVSEKASQISFHLMMPMLFLTSLALLAGGGKHEFYYLNALGIVLTYITVLGILIYLLTYWYFDKKTGGQ